MMPELESDLSTAILANAAISALIVDRIRPVKLPVDFQTPAITYRRTDSSEDMTHDGPSGIRRATVEFTCHGGKSYPSAKSTAAALYDFLNDYTATLTNFKILNTDVVSGEDEYEDEVDDFMIPIAAEFIYQNN